MITLKSYSDYAIIQEALEMLDDSCYEKVLKSQDISDIQFYKNKRFKIVEILASLDFEYSEEDMKNLEEDVI